MHNWASHGADAFRTLALGLHEDKPTHEELSRTLPRFAKNEYNIFGGS